MRNHGLVAFVITTAVLVPAAAHYLSAGHDQVVKFATATTSTLELAGAKIEARLEHPLVDPGESLRIKLVASSAVGKRLDVGLLVYGSKGDEDDRVPSPPVGVAHKTVSIAIDAEGNGSIEIAIPLAGAVENRYSPSPFTSYEVLVMAPRAATKLDRLRRNSALIGEGEGIPEYNASASKFMNLYSWRHDLQGEDATLFGEGVVARLDAHTRTINPAIAIETPSTTEVGKVFAVAVTVKNASRKPARGLVLDVETPIGVVDGAEGIEALVMPDNATFDLDAGESRRFQFRVMPDQVGVLGLYARVTCNGDDCDDDSALTKSGTFDATEIVKAQVVDAAPSIVGRK